MSRRIEEATAACCDACAPPTRVTLERRTSGRVTAQGGSMERQLTLLSILLAGGFVGLALLALLVRPSEHHATWLPLHLLLAGAAPTAMAGVMPFFSAAVSGAAPAGWMVRLAGILGIAVGALLVVAGWSWSSGVGSPGNVAATIGGAVYLAGLAAVAAATLLPLRAALGPRRIFMGAIYGLALVNVMLGASLSTLFVAGWTPVLGNWAALKPAHAWLNVFGFLSLVIAGSLLHLLPTVVGARIRRTAASIAAFVGLAAGPMLVALGFGLRSDVLAISGATTVIAGAGGLAWHAGTVMRARARWSTDRSWHRFTGWSLVGGIAWFLLGTSLAVGQVLGAGATAAGWQLAPLTAPLAIGWAGQVLVGSWSHLVPAVGPGSSDQHARQRRLLGRAAEARLVLLNGGVAALALAAPLGQPMLVPLGLLAAGTAGLAAVVLLGAAGWQVVGGQVPQAGRPRSPSAAISGRTSADVRRS